MGRCWAVRLRGMRVRQFIALARAILGAVPLLLACGSGQTGDAGLGDDPIETRRIEPSNTEGATQDAGETLAMMDADQEGSDDMATGSSLGPADPATAELTEESDSDIPSADADGGVSVARASRAIDGVVLLDDAEDGDNVTLGDELGFLGFWYSFDDRCDCNNDVPQGETYPVPAPLGGGEFRMTNYDAAGAPPAPVEGNQMSNDYGLRLQGGGHGLFGAGVGVGFNTEEGALAAFDLEQAGVTALRFQVRSGVPGDSFELAVSISDSFSEPAGELCIPRPIEQNWCDASWDGEFCDAQGCFDSPIYRLEVNNDWQTVTIPLSSFGRENWGIYVDDVGLTSGDLISSSAYQLQFRAPPGTAQFDLWLDNIGFAAMPPL